MSYTCRMSVYWRSLGITGLYLYLMHVYVYSCTQVCMYSVPAIPRCFPLNCLDQWAFCHSFPGLEIWIDQLPADIKGLFGWELLITILPISVLTLRVLSAKRRWPEANLWPFSLPELTTHHTAAEIQATTAVATAATFSALYIYALYILIGYIEEPFLNYLKYVGSWNCLFNGLWCLEASSYWRALLYLGLKKIGCNLNVAKQWRKCYEGSLSTVYEAIQIYVRSWTISLQVINMGSNDQVIKNNLIYMISYYYFKAVKFTLHQYNGHRNKISVFLQPSKETIQ